MEGQHPPITIAFLTSADPLNRKSWSGIYYQMLKSLEKQFIVFPLGPVKSNPILLKVLHLLALWTKLLWNKNFNMQHNFILGRYYASIFKKKLGHKKFDFIFAPAASTEIAFLKTTIPIIYFSDTSFSQIKDYYQIFSNLSKFSEFQSEAIQKKALENSSIMVHSSNWATDYVVKNYHINPNITHTLAMGANLDRVPDLSKVLAQRNSSSICKLIFLGVDWDRKGGALAFETLIHLNNLGIETELTVCGCIPPQEFTHKKMKVVPYLNKNLEQDYDEFINLMSESHFLILPTRAECSAIVYAEASAFGVPSITTDTGGVASMVQNSVNGYRLPIQAKSLDYALLIQEIFMDQERYMHLVYQSRAKFERELNWDTWGTQLKEIVINFKGIPALL